MVYAAVLGIFVTLMLTTQGGFLMEENGSQRAQILYNIIHFIVASMAILIAVGVMILLSFVNLESKDDDF
jgi:heme/copper-type cytochrome/quinol oxidase subunit 2